MSRNVLTHINKYKAFELKNKSKVIIQVFMYYNNWDIAIKKDNGIFENYECVNVKFNKRNFAKINFGEFYLTIKAIRNEYEEIVDFNFNLKELNNEPTNN